MRRGSVVILIVTAGLTGCSAFSSAPGSDGGRTAVRRSPGPRHRIALEQGQTQTFRPGTVGAPLSLVCRKPPGQKRDRTLTDVMRPPLRRDRSTVFLAGIGGPSLEVVVGPRGAVRVECEAR